MVNILGHLVYLCPSRKIKTNLIFALFCSEILPKWLKGFSVGKCTHKHDIWWREAIHFLLFLRVMDLVFALFFSFGKNSILKPHPPGACFWPE